MKGLSVVATVVLVVLMMHPWGGSTLNVSPVLSCTPDCTDTIDGDKVPDPRNCSNFYYCVSGEPTDHPTPCPPGEIFDPSTMYCSPWAECNVICKPGDAGCPLTCNGSMTSVGDVFNCSAYYVCTPTGYSGPFYCSVDRPHFDGENCVNDESACCTGYCEPYCDGLGFSMVPDPLNCTRYYICEYMQGIPGEEVHFTCGANEYFNVQLGECQVGIPDPCPTLCEAANRKWTNRHH